MKKIHRNISAGEAPEKVIFIGDKKMDKTILRRLCYSHDNVQETVHDDKRDMSEFTRCDGISWFQVYGVHDVELLAQLGKSFDIHPLILADIANTEHNPKMDIFDHQIFIELKRMIYNPKSRAIDSEQCSLLLGKNYVMSFLERDDDVFDPIIKRIKAGKQKITSASSGFLVYSLIDIIVDDYYSILEQIGEDIEDLEDNIIEKPSIKDIEQIHSIKHSLIYLRKAVWPLREVVKKFDVEAADFYDKSDYIYLRDLYDHIIQIIDTVETQREILAEILDIYLSSVSNKLNQIMKVLTIISTIFIPLTFISSIYGMNFKFMPELEWQWSYPILMTSMLIISGVMLFMFKRKGWFS